MNSSRIISSHGRRRIGHRHYSSLPSRRCSSSRALPSAHPSSSSSRHTRRTTPSHPARRFYRAAPTIRSDNLLGHSPMARPSPGKPAATTGDESSGTDKKGGAVWGVDSNAAGGGVWAQTSAKKDKLNELLTELNGEGVDTGIKGMESLDLAATPEEKLDLAFADGLKCIAKCVDRCMDTPANRAVSDSEATADNAIINAMQQTSQKTGQAIQTLLQMLSAATAASEGLSRPKFEATMNEAIRILSSSLPEDPTLKKPVAGTLDVNSSLCYIREFVAADDKNDSEEYSFDGVHNAELQKEMETLNQITSRAFSTSVHLYKTLLLRALAKTLSDNWEALTTPTSGDIDRAAVAKSPAATQRQRETVHAKSILQLFEAYDSSSCNHWVESWWALIDADGDGMIDQEEMNTVVELATKPVHVALKELVDIALEVCPSRKVGLGKNDDAWFLGGDASYANAASDPDGPTRRNRRAELSARKLLGKTFSSALARHFRDQVETPHRLRCVYAWAEKGHQSNKIDSVLVDASEEWGAASSVVGRKRYVELEPKISYEEFREVQSKHFAQLDSMGEEIASSFKEDLWVVQGKRRQNAELRRDCGLFLLGVSLVDVGIGLL